MAQNKTEQELRKEVEAKQVEAFLIEFDEVTKPIFKKHGYIIQPIIQTNQVGGMNPAFGVGKYVVEEVSPQDPIDNDPAQSKTE
jgi:purine nucleoside phosphorylase